LEKRCSRKNSWNSFETTENFVGILSEGLRVCPSTAYHNGTRFGTGIYFADMASKSLNYCADGDSKFLMLCEVVLGKTKAFSINRNAISELPAGYDSLHARGDTGPNFHKSIVLPNGVKIPTEMKPSTNKRWYSNPSEYIVPSPDQVRIRYLIHVKEGNM